MNCNLRQRFAQIPSQRGGRRFNSCHPTSPGVSPLFRAILVRIMSHITMLRCQVPDPSVCSASRGIFADQLRTISGCDRSDGLSRSFRLSLSISFALRELYVPVQRDCAIRSSGCHRRKRPVLIDMLVIGRDGFTFLLSPLALLRFRELPINACSSVADRLIFEARAASSEPGRILTLVALLGRARVMDEINGPGIERADVINVDRQCASTMHIVVALA